jgi:purine-binding chemotaxis protein CheW
MTVTPIYPPAERSSEFELCRAVVFTVANHYLALPLAAVLKVVPRSAVQHNYSDNQPMVYLESQPLTLLNLHACLSAIPSSNLAIAANPSVNLSSPRVSGQLLLITGLAGYPQWAIPVDQPPTLMELPLSTVRLLPPTYRQRIHNIACHVAVLTNSQELLTLLLLNLKQAAIALPHNQN